MGLISYLFGTKKEVKMSESAFLAWTKTIDNMTALQHRVLDTLESKVEEKLVDSSFSVKAVLTNSTLIAVCSDGDVLTSNGDNDLFMKVREAKSKDEVRNIMFPAVVEKEKAKEEQKKVEFETKQKEIAVQAENDKKLSEKVDLLVNSGEFKLRNNILYMKGIEIGIPKLLLDKLVKLVDKVLNGDIKNIDKYELEYNSLKNFWRWTSLCPNPQSREDMFRFLEGHDLSINKHGFFFAYRMVQSVAGADQKVLSSTTFISESKTKVKMWKKSAVNYDVYQNEDGYILYDLKKNKPVVGTRLGNLEELYKGLSSEENEQTYTDAYTGKFDIRIGKEVSMPREDCNEYNGDECSRGLHVGNKSFGFSGNGDTSILVLINPMNAVSIPSRDSHKMRVCAYYPVSVITGDEYKMKQFLESANVTELGEEYFIEQMDKLEKLVSENTPKELGDKRVVASEQTTESMESIVESFKDTKSLAVAAIANRVKKA